MNLSRWGFGALLVHSTLIQAIVFLLRPATTYQALESGAPAAALGAIGAAFALIPLVLAVPAGTLVDRYGTRVIMLIGSVITLIAAIGLLTLGTTIAGLLASTALLGAGHLGCIVSQQSIVANVASRGHLDSLFGYYTFAASLGQAVGPMLIAVVGGSAVHPDTGILFAIGTGLAGILLILSFAIPDRRAAVAPSGADPESWWAILRMRGVARAIATSALIVAAVDLTVVYIPALGAERGMTAIAVGALLAVRAVASMVSRLLLGRVAGRIGRARLMTISICTAAVGLIALAFPLPLPLLFVSCAAMGLGLGVGQPLTMSWVTEQVPPNRRGTALAVRLAGNRLSQVSIPALLGVFAAGLGAAAVLGATGAVIAGTLLLVRGVRLDGDEPRDVR